ncbi:Poly [ADP-ribose] polymerase 2 [Strongyloides ratti]|uniref:Poly [ADP-ribose] polymerase n=1 Tax=Strongyloides ratti TaxID=34506 RepID=A0A090LLA6_STRRB|nr:Poly [ADP-ribose] polymerase 2 [Strongyloides ratti]CEF70500.1 Poly [ADP-ribose] polymerase 2 [Strongyloides ratti]
MTKRWYDMKRITLNKKLEGIQMKVYGNLNLLCTIGMTTRSRAKGNVDKTIESKDGDNDSKKNTKKKKENSSKNVTNVSKKKTNEATSDTNDNKDTLISVSSSKVTRNRRPKDKSTKDSSTDLDDKKVENTDTKNDGKSSLKSDNTKDDAQPAPKSLRERKKKVDQKNDSDVKKKNVSDHSTSDNLSTDDTSKTDPEKSSKDPPTKVLSRGRKKKNDTQDDSGLKQKAAKIEANISDTEKCDKNKKVIMPVDAFATTRQVGWSVFVDKDLGPYSITLNQTDVTNNNNKFIILQVLKKNGVEEYSFFQRWGRVGFSGQCNLQNGDQNHTINNFLHKFKNKTGQDYKGHIEYEKKPKKYFPIEMKGEEVNSEDESETINIPESKLEESVRRVMELICDTKLMASTLKEMNFDLDKMPLGKLSKNQITAGYECLKDIETAITAKNKAGIIEAVDMYYTNIPHFFGMKKPKLIETIDDLKKEIELLDTLWDIEATMKTMKEEKPKKEIAINPLDEFYDKMKCGLKVLSPKNKMRKIIEDVIQNTQGPTHTWYKYNVKNVFEVKRETEDEKFLKDIPNRKLLWHGSRVTNWYGILSQGLRIAPKEAPSSGYMFDKGIYMADLSSKSIGYCFASPGQTGFLALVEAAIGNQNVKLQPDYKASKKLQKDEHSVKGEGKMIPEKEIKLENGSVLYNGPIVSNKTYKPDEYTLYYNEYIVYNTDQVRLRYLVELEFVNQ